MRKIYTKPEAVVIEISTEYAMLQESTGIEGTKSGYETIENGWEQ